MFYIKSLKFDMRRIKLRAFYNIVAWAEELGSSDCPKTENDTERGLEGMVLWLVLFPKCYSEYELMGCVWCANVLRPEPFPTKVISIFSLIQLHVQKRWSKECWGESLASSFQWWY